MVATVKTWYGSLAIIPPPAFIGFGDKEIAQFDSFEQAEAWAKAGSSRYFEHYPQEEKVVEREKDERRSSGNHNKRRGK